MVKTLVETTGSVQEIYSFEGTVRECNISCDNNFTEIIVTNPRVGDGGTYCLYGFVGLIGGRKIKLYTQALTAIAFQLLDTGDNVLLNPHGEFKGKERYEFRDQ